MKLIGLIGGMSWESSSEYYRQINRTVRERCGGLNSARTLMYSVNFAQIEDLQRQNKWQEITDVLVDAAKRLECGGAEILLICTNTMHKVADDIQAQINIPILHIADATAQKVQEHGLKTVGLLGTKFTMEQNFYRGRLEQKHGLHVVIPSPEDREIVNQVIYNELCVGTVLLPSKADYLMIIERLIEQGAEGIIAGCTEIGMLIHEDDCPVPYFDTMHIHAMAAVDYALNGG